VCDGNNIAACGVPVVDTMGVRGGKIHSMEEYLIVDSLKRARALSRADHPAAGGEAHELPRPPRNGEDFRAIYQMAKLTGGGFTNLPADRGTLVAKLARSENRSPRRRTPRRRPLRVRARGPEDPQRSAAPARCSARSASSSPSIQLSYEHADPDQPGARQDLPQPDADPDHRPRRLVRGRRAVPPPEVRAGGWGSLLARSRYLFMKLHRARFGDRTLAELRGVMDEAGNAPFWDALAGRFFGMTFPEADEFNASTAPSSSPT
jgi:arginine N-succinyltransferase